MRYLPYYPPISHPIIANKTTPIMKLRITYLYMMLSLDHQHQARPGAELDIIDAISYNALAPIPSNHLIYIWHLSDIFIANQLSFLSQFTRILPEIFLHIFCLIYVQYYPNFHDLRNPTICLMSLSSSPHNRQTFNMS